MKTFTVFLLLSTTLAAPFSNNTAVITSVQLPKVSDAIGLDNGNLANVLSTTSVQAPGVSSTISNKVASIASALSTKAASLSSVPSSTSSTTSNTSSTASFTTVKISSSSSSATVNISSTASSKLPNISSTSAASTPVFTDTPTTAASGASSSSTPLDFGLLGDGGDSSPSTGPLTSSDGGTVPVNINVAVPGVSKVAKTYPFDRIVVYGDDYSDDTSGSYAHGITGDPVTGAGKALWGAGTWTDGPVAVSYLSQSLGLPIQYNYAFGSSLGAQKIGSVCNISAVKSGQIGSYAKLLNGNTVPDALQQIANYSGNPAMRATSAKSLHVLWTGNNDMIASLGWTGRFTICTDGLCTPGQNNFLNGFNNCMRTTLLNLIATGAKYILVPDIYPRHLTPWTSQWITSNTSYIANFGSVIDRANANTQATITALNKAYGTKIVYFPANQIFKAGIANPLGAGIGPGAGGATAPGYVNTCVDGCGAQGPLTESNWSLYWAVTIVGKGADQFVWMTSVVASTGFMKYVANWMNYYVQATTWT